MTDETKKRIPGIIERIDELRDEVEKIHEEKVNEFHEYRKEMDCVGQLIAAKKVEQLFGAYIWLDNAARTLENY